MSDQLSILSPEDLPQTDEPKKKEQVNCLQDMLLELMDDRGVTPAQIQKATGIPWGTLQSWIVGDVGAQLLDKNIFKLAQFFNVSISYLAFGVGDDSPEFKDFKTDEAS